MDFPSFEEAESVLVHHADRLLGTVIRLDAHDIPPDKLRWLKTFLRQHLSRPEYQTIAAVNGWAHLATRNRLIEMERRMIVRRRDRAAGVAPSSTPPPGFELDDEIPF